jgi:hypothetical protein
VIEIRAGAIGIAPYIAITNAEKSSGKTLLLELLEMLGRQALADGQRFRGDPGAEDPRNAADAPARRERRRCRLNPVPYMQPRGIRVDGLADLRFTF